MPKLNQKQAKQAAEADDYEAVPPGTYLAVLAAVSEKKGQAGPYWEWQFQLQETDEGEELERKVKIWENTSLSEQAIFRVAQMFAAFEVDTDTDTEDLLGLYVMVNVGQEVAEQGARAGQLRNTFLSAFPVPGDDEYEEDDAEDTEAE